MVCPGIRQQVADGDVLRVEIEQGIVYNLTQSTEIRGEKISDYTMNILNHGELNPYSVVNIANRAHKRIVYPCNAC